MRRWIRTLRSLNRRTVYIIIKSKFTTVIQQVKEESRIRVCRCLLVWMLWKLEEHARRR